MRESVIFRSGKRLAAIQYGRDGRQVLFTDIVLPGTPKSGIPRSGTFSHNIRSDTDQRQGVNGLTIDCKFNRTPAREIIGRGADVLQNCRKRRAGRAAQIVLGDHEARNNPIIGIWPRRDRGSVDTRMEIQRRPDGVFGEVEGSDEPVLILSVPGIPIGESRPNKAERHNDAAENENTLQRATNQFF